MWRKRRSANDLCEKDRGADVGSGYVTKDDTKDADEPDGGVYLIVGSADEPSGEDVDTALVCKALDEDELRKCEGNEGERKPREGSEERGEVLGKAIVCT